MPTTPQWQNTLAALGRATKARKSPEVVAALRQQLRAERYEAQLAKVLAGAPPLTAEQRDSLAALFRGAAGDLQESA